MCWNINNSHTNTINYMNRIRNYLTHKEYTVKVLEWKRVYAVEIKNQTKENGKYGNVRFSSFTFASHRRTTKWEIYKNKCHFKGVFLLFLFVFYLFDDASMASCVCFFFGQKIEIHETFLFPWRSQGKNK